ncbi:hypothetical protein [Ruegeria atlantica]|uniref:hypothetical protein n=1 Tax=Ruegeria atlantica TaxID=81569 RepID=UPI0011AE432C|nr:hypothetical protein [Ruegeria atlantica]
MAGIRRVVLDSDGSNGDADSGSRDERQDSPTERATGTFLPGCGNFDPFKPWSVTPGVNEYSDGIGGSRRVIVVFKNLPQTPRIHPDNIVCIPFFSRIAIIHILSDCFAHNEVTAAFQFFGHDVLQKSTKPIQVRKQLTFAHRLQSIALVDVLNV